MSLRIPATVEGTAGPITVEVLPAVKDDDGAPCWGLWRQGERRITVQRMPNTRQMWATFYHELAHAAMDDAGVSHFLTEEQQEALADAIATARVRERFG